MNATIAGKPVDGWRALSFKQPWAWAVLTSGVDKDIDNRPRLIRFIGDFLIHASQSESAKYWCDSLEWMLKAGVSRDKQPPRFGSAVKRGGIIGRARVVQIIVHDHGEAKRWYMPGSVGYVLADVIPLPFVACSGARGFWRVDREVIHSLHMAGGDV